MDLSQIDMSSLCAQLRKPEGEAGKEVGQTMMQYNSGAIEFMFECLQVQPTDHVLEIGFGPGEAIAEAVRLTRSGYVAGIDHSPLMFQMASERNNRAMLQEHVELTLGEAAQLPYADNSFDTVFAVNVLHFWADQSPELQECKRVLKPGGTVALYVSFPSTWPAGMSATGVFVAREPAQAQALLSAAGFQNVRVREITFTHGKGFTVLGTK